VLSTEGTRLSAAAADTVPDHLRRIDDLVEPRVINGTGRQAKAPLEFFLNER